MILPLHQLVYVRRARGLSQAQLGHKAGFPQQYISELELGRRPIDPDHVVRIAAILGVEPAALSTERITICTSPSGVVIVNHV